MEPPTNPIWAAETTISTPDTAQDSSIAGPQFLKQKRASPFQSKVGQKMGTKWRSKRMILTRKNRDKNKFG